jgi:hypothetical protein
MAKNIFFVAPAGENVYLTQQQFNYGGCIMEVDKDYAGGGTTAMAITSLVLAGANALGRLTGGGNLAPLLGEGANSRAELIVLREEAKRDREVLDLKLELLKQQNAAREQASAFNLALLQKDVKLVQSFINVTGAFSTAAVSLATLSPVTPVLEQGSQGT